MPESASDVKIQVQAASRRSLNSLSRSEKRLESEVSFGAKI
jgi:hypothetical protein